MDTSSEVVLDLNTSSYIPLVVEVEPNASGHSDKERSGSETIGTNS